MSENRADGRGGDAEARGRPADAAGEHGRPDDARPVDGRAPGVAVPDEAAQDSNAYRGVQRSWVPV